MASSSKIEEFHLSFLVAHWIADNRWGCSLLQLIPWEELESSYRTHQFSATIELLQNQCAWHLGRSLHQAAAWSE